MIGRKFENTIMCKIEKNLRLTKKTENTFLR